MDTCLLEDEPSSNPALSVWPQKSNIAIERPQTQVSMLRRIGVANASLVPGCIPSTISLSSQHSKTYTYIPQISSEHQRSSKFPSDFRRDPNPAAVSQT